MRQVYALLGLVKTWSADRVDIACASALALAPQQVNVGLMGRMLERGTGNAGPPPMAPADPVIAGRFARDPGHFAVARTAKAAR